MNSDEFKQILKYAKQFKDMTCNLLPDSVKASAAPEVAAACKSLCKLSKTTGIPLDAAAKKADQATKGVPLAGAANEICSCFCKG